MDDIIRFLEQSIADELFSKDEKKDLRFLIQQQGLTEEEMHLLRNKVYALAKSASTDKNYRFILDWLQYATGALLAATTHHQSSAYFSPGETCRQAIIGQINAAVSNLDICVFTISDDRIADTILAAHHKGIAVKILTDNDKSFDVGSDIGQLAKAGIAIKIDQTTDHMHHKFMIVDGRSLLTGSYNWTSSAARVNQENIIVTDDSILVSDFKREFARLWQGMHIYQ